VAKQKAAHHRGDFQRAGDKAKARAYADPSWPCWRCGRTLAQHPRHKTGRPPSWHYGHTAGPTSPRLPEVSTCNVRDGASIGGRIIAARKRRAKVRRTALTW
jgi:hypothetical protein